MISGLEGKLEVIYIIAHRWYVPYKCWNWFCKIGGIGKFTKSLAAERARSLLELQAPCTRTFVHFGLVTLLEAAFEKSNHAPRLAKGWSGSGCQTQRSEVLGGDGDAVADSATIRGTIAFGGFLGSDGPYRLSVRECLADACAST